MQNYQHHAEWVSCPDGRRVKVTFYVDGKYGFEIEDRPLVIEHAFLPGPTGNVTLKLSRRADTPN